MSETYATKAEWEELQTDARRMFDELQEAKTKLAEFEGMWCCTLKDREAEHAWWEILWEVGEAAALLKWRRFKVEADTVHLYTQQSEDVTKRLFRALKALRDKREARS